MYLNQCKSLSRRAFASSCHYTTDKVLKYWEKSDHQPNLLVTVLTQRQTKKRSKTYKTLMHKNHVKETITQRCYIKILMSSSVPCRTLLQISLIKDQERLY